MYDPNVLLQKTKLRIEEAAELLDVTPRTVNRYMTDGKIAFTRTPGGHRRPLTESVKKYI
jgi:excisionase family DNA binding protein